MTDKQYKLIPLKETQSIPVQWFFSQNDYDKLVNGHRSNWCVFLRDDIVHVCRIGGEEFYRFTLKKSSQGSYEANALEAYENGRQIDIKQLAIEETAGLLRGYFNIDVNRT